MFENIKSDLAVNYSTISKLVCINYRFGNYAYKHKNILLKVVYKLMNAITKIISSSDISASSNIGKSLRLEHGAQGIVIHSTAMIGERARVFHQTTIGVTGNKGEYVAAVIGDDALIGVGAKIIGNVNIGNKVKIGANAVVTKDIPDNSTAVGIPARIV